MTNGDNGNDSEKEPEPATPDILIKGPKPDNQQEEPPIARQDTMFFKEPPEAKQDFMMEHIVKTDRAQKENTEDDSGEEDSNNE